MCRVFLKKDNVNGMIFRSMSDFLMKMHKMNDDDINRMGNNARFLVKEKLNICNMANNACSIFNH